MAVFLIAACNGGDLSKSKKDAIQFTLEIHNSNPELKFKLDSVTEGSNFEISLLKYHLSKDSSTSLIKRQMKIFANDWNTPYDIKKDRDITLDKYVDYCKDNKYDPETYYKVLD